jgi:hypothetical protein
VWIGGCFLIIVFPLILVFSTDSYFYFPLILLLQRISVICGDRRFLCGCKPDGEKADNVLQLSSARRIEQRMVEHRLSTRVMTRRGMLSPSTSSHCRQRCPEPTSMRSLEPSLPSFPAQAFPRRILRWLGGRVDAGRFLEHGGKCAVAPPSRAARGVADRQLNSGLQALVAMELRGLAGERRTVISKLRNIARRRCAVGRVPVVVVVVHVDDKRTGVGAPTPPRFLQPALGPSARPPRADLRAPPSTSTHALDADGATFAAERTLAFEGSGVGREVVLGRRRVCKLHDCRLQLLILRSRRRWPPGPSYAPLRRRRRSRPTRPTATDSSSRSVSTCTPARFPVSIRRRPSSAPPLRAPTYGPLPAWRWLIIHHRRARKRPSSGTRLRPAAPAHGLRRSARRRYRASSNAFAMKRCNHSRWLSVCEQSSKPALVQSDRLAALVQGLAAPSVQQPSLFVLVGGAEKSAAMQAVFDIKKDRLPVMNHSRSEIHLHLAPSTALADRPVLLASCNVRRRPARWAVARQSKCHKETRHALRQLPPGGEGTNKVLARLLFPFADVLCFFSDDLGGFRQTAQRLALWLEQSRSSTAAEVPLPGVVIVTSKLPPSAAAEAQAKRAFLWMLEEEMGVELGADLPKQLSAIDVVAIRLRGATWTDAVCRRVKGRLMKQSDQVRRRRAASRALYSATHMAAFLKGAGAHLARSLDAPFDFIHASRLQNPVAPDLAEHLSNFLGCIDSSDQLTEFAAPMIASTMLLDNYPPGAHGTCQMSGAK